MIRGVKFVTVPTRDQYRAVAFYTEKLGFSIHTDQPFAGGQRWIELRIPGAETRLALFTPDGWESRIGEFQGFTFWADDVEKTYAELLAKGVEFGGPPTKESWGTFVVMKDADGNQFVIGSKT